MAIPSFVYKIILTTAGLGSAFGLSQYKDYCSEQTSKIMLRNHRTFEYYLKRESVPELAEDIKDLEYYIKTEKTAEKYGNICAIVGFFGLLSLLKPEESFGLPIGRNDE
jgi:hypothetical protein